MANETVTLLRSAKIPRLGWRRGQAIIGKTGKVTPDYMFLGKWKDKRKVYAPEGHYVLRYFDGRLPRYKKLGNDPSEALDELQRAKSELKFKNAAKTAGYIIPAPTPVKRKSLAEYGREFLEQKRSPSLKLDEDTIKLYTVIVEEFVPLSGRTYAEDITEGDVIRYCDELDKRYSDGVRARRYTSLRGFLFYCGLEPKRLITASVHKRLKSFEKKKVRIYNGAELTALLAVCDPYHHALFMVALLTGMRDDELGHLLWQQVDFEANVIRLAGYEIQHKGKTIKFRLKDREARNIPLFPMVRDELLRLRALRPNAVFALGTKNDLPNVKILYALKSKARKAGLNCGFCRGCAARKECHRFHVHYFRSSFASYALKRNDIRRVMDDGLDGVGRAEVTAQHRELSEGAGAGGGVAFFNGAVQTQHAGDDARSVSGNDAGKKYDVADGASGDVIAAGSRRRGQSDRELLQSSFGSGWHEATFLLKNIATL